MEIFINSMETKITYNLFTKNFCKIVKNRDKYN